MPAAVLVLGSLLLIFAYLVFRRIVRQEYRARGRLRLHISLLQLLVFAAFFCFPYLYNPLQWQYFWQPPGPANRTTFMIGFALICLGFLVAFGTMAWFGMGRAFGMDVSGLVRRGPYRLSRNPQVIGGYLLVIGVAWQWPSLYTLGWVLMYATLMHWMIATEEEHLARTFGEAYAAYRAEVPRYLWFVPGS